MVGLQSSHFFTDRLRERSQCLRPFLPPPGHSLNLLLQQAFYNKNNQNRSQGNPTSKVENTHTIMSNSSINATYTSAYIDKDEKLITNQMRPSNTLNIPQFHNKQHQYETFHRNHKHQYETSHVLQNIWTESSLYREVLQMEFYQCESTFFVSETSGGPGLGLVRRKKKTHLHLR